ncbi:MAG TPA: hypothetical protein VH063_16955 [Gaiellaceae bacterium]|jgi:hypothetical protein|nr:hypothetical protein [Gaiellaceae bacterium]
MSRAQTIFVGVAITVLATATAASAARVNGAWTTFYPVGQPVTVSLPSSWQNSQPSGHGEVFFAESPDAISTLELLVSRYGAPAAGFASDMARRARQVYLAQDPHAVVRSRRVTVSAGNGLEVITSLVRRQGSKSYPLSVESYAFLRHGKIYEFVYLTLTPEAGEYFPVFDRSVHSIRFG